MPQDSIKIAESGFDSTSWAPSSRLLPLALFLKHEFLIAIRGALLSTHFASVYTHWPELPKVQFVRVFTLSMISVNVQSSYLQDPSPLLPCP